MSKGKKILIAVLVALLCAGLAVYSIILYLTPMKETIYVYNNNYEAGKTVSSAMFTPILVDEKIVIGGREASVNEQFVAGDKEFYELMNAGDSLLVDVYKGQVLTMSDLSVASGTAIEKNLATNAIAVTINLNNTSGVTNGLRLGSRVNVYSSFEGVTTLLLENMRIIKVNKSDNSLVSITLECTQEEAVKIIYAQEYTSVHLGLINENEYEYANGTMTYGVPTK